MYTKLHTSRGMSLLEMLLVIALLGLLASVTFVALSRGGGSTEIDMVAEQVRAELATMRSRARSGENRAAFGIFFATSSYTGIEVRQGATTTLHQEQLPTGITATEGTILFKTISGASSPAGVTLTTSGGITRAITVEASGSFR